MMNISLSISIVLFKPKIETLSRLFLALKAAIDEFYKQGLLDLHVYLIDNSVCLNENTLVKDLADKFFLDAKNVSFSFLNNQKNLGYGAGNNLAIMRSQSKYHVIMNPDVFVDRYALLNAIQYMEAHPDVGLLAPSIYSEDGDRQFLCKKNPTIFDMYLRGFAPRFIKNLFSRRMLEFEMRDKDYGGEMRDVPFLSGCFMFMRTDVLKKLNGFDEDFFLYFEDADLSRRLLDISHSAYVPQVKIVHQWARESQKKLKMLWIFIKSALLYWKKHGGLY